MKKIRLIIIILILLTFNTIYSFVDKSEKIYNSDISSGAYTNIGGMTEGFSVSQEFICKYKNLSELSIRFATFDRVNKGSLNYKIIEKNTNKEIVKGNIDTSKIVNNEFNKIKFDTIKDSKDKEYILIMDMTGVEAENVITIYSTESVDKNLDLTVNGVKKNNEALVLKVNCKKVFDIETFIVLICFELYVAFFLKILYKYLA